MKTKTIILVAGATYSQNEGKYIGTAGSGKDEFSRMLVEEARAIGVSADTFKFANSLKQMCDSTFTLTVGGLFNNVFSEIGKILVRSQTSPDDMALFMEQVNRVKFVSENWYERKNEFTRLMLQLVGTDVVRTVNPGYWIMETWKQIMTSNVELAVVSDLRFPNEEEAFVRFRNQISHVEDHRIITKVVKRLSALSSSQGVAGHPSEQEYPHGDAEAVINDRGLDDLRWEARDVVNRLFGK